MRRRALLMGGKSAPNTIIGGVGSVITTKSALATKLGISESIISGFKIVGSDVHFRARDNYNIATDCFNGDLSITKYVDLDGRVENIWVRSFQSSSIKNIYLPNAVFGDFAFAYCSQLINDEYGGVLNYNQGFLTGGQACLRGTKIPTVNINLADKITLESFHSWIGESINFYGTSIENSAFRTAQFKYANFPNVTNISALAFYQCQGSEELSFPLIVTLDNAGQSFRQLTRTKRLYMDSLETITENAKNVLFRDCTSMELIRMRKLKTFGTATSNNDVWTRVKTGVEIQVNIELATINSGNAEASLAWAKANRSAIVNFYDDSGNYVSTL